MARFTISKQDLAKGMPGPIGWYKATLKSFTKEKAKDGNSMNWVPIFDYTSDTEREIRCWFSEKSLSLQFARFYYAIQNKKLAQAEDISVDTDDIKIGSEIMIHIILTYVNGRAFNNVDDFLPISEETPPF